jgi:hypothetical protein
MACDYAWSYTGASTDVCAPAYATRGARHPGRRRRDADRRGVVTTRACRRRNLRGRAAALRGFIPAGRHGRRRHGPSVAVFVFNATADVYVRSDAPREASPGRRQSSGADAAVQLTGALKKSRRVRVGRDVPPTTSSSHVASGAFLGALRGDARSACRKSRARPSPFQLARFEPGGALVGRPLVQPTMRLSTGGAAAAYAGGCEQRNRIIVDDGDHGQNATRVGFAAGGAPLSAANHTLRGGDVATGSWAVTPTSWSQQPRARNASACAPPHALGGRRLHAAQPGAPTPAPLVNGALKVPRQPATHLLQQLLGCRGGVGRLPRPTAEAPTSPRSRAP